MDAYAELFPYWSKRQIERIIKSCKEKELIITGNFNKTAYDRTMWYAVGDIVERAYAIKRDS